MIQLHTFALDCAPLEADTEARISAADLRRIERLQGVLLSPLDHPTVDDWRAAVNRALVDALGGDAAMFQLDLPGTTLHYSDELDFESLAEYEEWMPNFRKSKHIYRRALRLGAGNRYTLWKKHLGWLYRSEYFNGLISDLRAFDTLWVSAPLGASRYPAMLHTYHDHPTRGPRFGPTDLELMRLVRPALQAGARTVLRMAANRASLTTSLDAKRDGALVYDAGGDLLHRNPAMARIARTRRDEKAILRAGREMARDLASRETVDLLRPESVGRTLTTRTSAFEMSAVRLGEGTFTLQPAILVTVGAGPPPLPDRDTLRDRFGLTGRQAEVALLLTQRKTNPEMAELLCISEHTVRSHVESVMAKFEVHDRRDIERKLREN